MFGKIITEKHRQKLVATHIGVAKPDYVKQKISVTRKLLGLKPSKETLQAARIINTGRKQSDEEKEKRSATLKKYWEGRTRSKEQRGKISLSLKKYWEKKKYNNKIG